MLAFPGNKTGWLRISACEWLFRKLEKLGSCHIIHTLTGWPNGRTVWGRSDFPLFVIVVTLVRLGDVAPGSGAVEEVPRRQLCRLRGWGVHSISSFNAIFSLSS